jgi:hypothetical protein
MLTSGDGASWAVPGGSGGPEIANAGAALATKPRAAIKTSFFIFQFPLVTWLTTIVRLPFSQSDADAAVSIAKM